MRASSDHCEPSDSRMSRSLLHRGSVPALDRSPTRSSALRFVSRLVWGVVVGSIEADVPAPAPDHRDVAAGRGRLYRNRVREAVERSRESPGDLTNLADQINP